MAHLSTDMEQDTQTEGRRSQKRGRREAGRMGGITTAKRHGADHFRRIGRLGGKARGQRQD